MTLVSHDSRRTQRFKPLRSTQVLLNAGGHQHSALVHDYSVQGLAVDVEPFILGHLLARASELEVQFPAEWLPCQVRHTVQGEDGMRVGVSLPRTSSELSFRSVDAGWDLLEDSEQLKTILEDLVSKGPEVFVEIRQLGGRANVTARSFTSAGIVTDVFESLEGPLQPGRAQCRFELFQTSHAFETTISIEPGGSIVIALPFVMARLLRRQTFRVRNGANGQFLKLELQSHFLGGGNREVMLYDFSEHGISAVDPTGWVEAPRGVTFENVVLTTAQGVRIAGRGSVRGYRRVRDVNNVAVGIAFETASYEDRTRWHNTILSARYPMLTFEYRATDHEQIWDLFDRSGYLDMKPRESFTHLVDVTRHTWVRMAASGTRLAKRMLIRTGNDVLGNMQLDRLYPETWCAHSLAIDPKQSKIVAGQIYGATADILSAEGARYLFTITDAEVPWNQRNYYDFVARYPFPEHNELKHFVLHEADLERGWDLPACSGLRCSPASKYDLQRISRYFEVYGSPLAYKALGLDPENLMLAPLDAELRPYGLSRRRELIVGSIDGEFVGFASAETGTAGWSVFGMQYCLQIYVLPILGERRHEVFDGLLREALELYGQWGVRNVNVYMEEERKEHFEERGLRYIEKAIRWLSDCTATRRYNAFTQMMYGHLLLRRQAGRRREKRT